MSHPYDEALKRLDEALTLLEPSKGTSPHIDNAIRNTTLASDEVLREITSKVRLKIIR